MFDLSQALVRVMPLAAKDDVRAALQSVLFEANAEHQKITVSCADGFKAGRAVIEAKVERDFRKMVPTKSLAWINARKMYYSPLSFLLDPERMNGGGSYPNLDAVYPTKEPLITCSIPEKLMTSVAKMWSLYKQGYKHTGGALYWSISRYGHVLETRFSDGITSRSEFNADIETVNEPFWYCVNILNLVEVFGAMKYEPELQAQFFSQNAPVQFCTPDSSCKWLVMPMHGGNYSAREVRK
jgi:hypothetical protein